MTQVKSTLAELLVVTIVGTAISLAANGLSSRGLNLARDYFPKGRPVATSRPSTSPTSLPTTAVSATSLDETLKTAVKAIQDDGLQPIFFDGTAAAFKDPLYQAGLYIFIDDRKDEDYREGHIPGAYHFYYMHKEQYLPELLPICRQAIKIVVYCSGGDCEDSRFGAVELLKEGIPPGTLFVYPGGFTEWCRKNQPVERGSRGSGDIVPGSKMEEAH